MRATSTINRGIRPARLLRPAVDPAREEPVDRPGYAEWTPALRRTGRPDPRTTALSSNMHTIYRHGLTGAVVLTLMAMPPALAGSPPPYDERLPCNSTCKDWLQARMVLFGGVAFNAASATPPLPVSAKSGAVTPSSKRSRHAARPVLARPGAEHSVRIARLRPAALKRISIVRRHGADGMAGRTTPHRHRARIARSGTIPLPPTIERAPPSVSADPRAPILHPSLARQVVDGEDGMMSAVPAALVERPILLSDFKAPVRLSPIGRELMARTAMDPSGEPPRSKPLDLPDPEDVHDVDRDTGTRPPTAAVATVADRPDPAALPRQPDRPPVPARQDPDALSSYPIPPAAVVLALSLVTLLGGLTGAPRARSV